MRIPEGRGKWQQARVGTRPSCSSNGPLRLSFASWRPQWWCGGPSCWKESLSPVGRVEASNPCPHARTVGLQSLRNLLSSGGITGPPSWLCPKLSAPPGTTFSVGGEARVTHEDRCVPAKNASTYCTLVPARRASGRRIIGLSPMRTLRLEKEHEAKRFTWQPPGRGT
jgi:hypothetical protein